jgi:hypothetical protein
MGDWPTMSKRLLTTCLRSFGQPTPERGPTRYQPGGVGPIVALTAVVNTGRHDGELGPGSGAPYTKIDIDPDERDQFGNPILTAPPANGDVVTFNTASYVVTLVDHDGEGKVTLTLAEQR